MKILNKGLITIGAALMLFTAGCASGRNSRSTGQVIDDTAILTKAKAALIDDAVVHGTAIDVDVNKGMVTLTGAVNGEVEKRKAEEIVRGVPGVQSVQNNIVIRHY